MQPAGGCDHPRPHPSQPQARGSASACFQVLALQRAGPGRKPLASPAGVHPVTPAKTLFPPVGAGRGRSSPADSIASNCTPGDSRAGGVEPVVEAGPRRSLYNKCVPYRPRPRRETYIRAANSLLSIVSTSNCFNFKPPANFPLGPFARTSSHPRRPQPSHQHQPTHATWRPPGSQCLPGTSSAGRGRGAGLRLQPGAGREQLGKSCARRGVWRRHCRVPGFAGEVRTLLGGGAQALVLGSTQPAHSALLNPPCSLRPAPAAARVQCCSQYGKCQDSCVNTCQCQFSGRLSTCNGTLAFTEVGVPIAPPAGVCGERPRTAPPPGAQPTAPRPRCWAGFSSVTRPELMAAC
jgi:hypothetical protein